MRQSDGVGCFLDLQAHIIFEMDFFQNSPAVVGNDFPYLIKLGFFEEEFERFAFGHHPET